jgi:DNA-binding HxlR family transcriptional regulator
MTKASSQFCPISAAADILAQRWVVLILRDLHGGCSRFNELRRALPKLSPSLLSQRLKMLQGAGLIVRTEDEKGATYGLTEAGKETLPIVRLFGIWGQRWQREQMKPDELDEGVLLYYLSSGLDRSYLAKPRTVIKVELTDEPRRDWPEWWMIFEPDEVDTCVEDPGFDVDFYIFGTLEDLFDVWHGRLPLHQALDDGRIDVAGDLDLERNFIRFFRGSPYAELPRPPDYADVVELLRNLD